MSLTEATDHDLINECIRRGFVVRQPVVVTEVLTERQKQVLDCLRKGAPNKVIAYVLDIGESTVKVHIRSIMKALGAKNRTEILVKAGWVA